MITAKSLVDARQVPNVETTVYTVPTGFRAIIDKCTLTNTTGAGCAVTVKLIPSGSGAGAANTIISAQALAAGQAYTCPEIVGHTIGAGDQISVLGSVNLAATLKISGREIN